MKSDFAKKGFLRRQINKSKLPYIIGFLGMGVLASIVGVSELRELRAKKDFLNELRAAQVMEYTFNKDETLHTACANEGLEGYQRNLCVDYVKELNPFLYKRVNEFPWPDDRVLIPDFNKDDKVGYQR